MEAKEIRHLAALARIRVAESEVSVIAEKFARVLGYVSLIQKVHTSGTEISETGAIRNVMREDGPPHESGAYSEAILRNVPLREGQFVKVKKIL